MIVLENGTKAMRFLSAFWSEKQFVKDLSLFLNIYVSKVWNTLGLRILVDSFLGILCVESITLRFLPHA